MIALILPAISVFVLSPVILSVSCSVILFCTDIHNVLAMSASFRLRMDLSAPTSQKQARFKPTVQAQQLASLRITNEKGGFSAWCFCVLHHQSMSIAVLTTLTLSNAGSNHY